MQRTVKIKITKVRQQLIKPTNRLRCFCTACDREVEMLTEDEAAGILDIDQKMLSRLIDTREIHSAQTVVGGRWVCKESLFVKDPLRYPEGK